MPFSHLTIKDMEEKIEYLKAKLIKNKEEYDDGFLTDFYGDTLSFREYCDYQDDIENDIADLENQIRIRRNKQDWETESFFIPIDQVRH